MLAFLGCDRTERPVATQPEVTPQPEAPPRAFGPIADPSRETTLGPRDMTPIREITLELPTGGKGFDIRKPGVPRSVFSAPHLTFVGNGPLAPGRILVAIKETAEYESKTLETHLVDLDRGSIAKFWRASNWQAPNLGLAWVTIDILGVGHPALLHASDGLLIRLYEHLDPTTTQVVVNPGRGDGWVFAHDPRELDAPTRYAHWEDLRSPPPKPDRVLPFSVTNPAHFATDAGARDRPRMTQIELPSVSDPRAVDPIVFNEAYEDGCNRLELRSDGSYACADYVLALAGGWRVGKIERNPVLYNLETKHVQHLDITEHCLGAYSEFAIAGSTFDPPRVLFECPTQGYELLWSPDALEIVRDRGRDHLDWARNRAHRSVMRYDPVTGELAGEGWLDLDDRVMLSTPDLDHFPLRTPSPVHVVTPVAAPGDVFAAYPNVAEGVLVARTRCAMLGEEAQQGPFVMLTCEDAAERARSTELIDTENRIRWHLPAAQGDWQARAWVDLPSRHVVMHQRRSGKSVVEVRDF
jgi:hypothetical protein